MAPVRATAKFLLTHHGGTVKALYDRYAIAKTLMRFAERQGYTSERERLQLYIRGLLIDLSG